MVNTVHENLGTKEESKEMEWKNAGVKVISLKLGE